QWSMVCDVLSQAAQLEASPIERAQLLRELGDTLAEQLLEPARAAAAYQAAIEADPNDTHSLAALSKLFDELQAPPPARVELARASVRAAPTEATIILSPDDLESPELETTLRRLAESLLFDPAHPEATAELRALFAAPETMTLLGELQERELSDPRAVLTARLASVLAELLGKLELDARVIQHATLKLELLGLLREPEHFKGLQGLVEALLEAQLIDDAALACRQRVHLPSADESADFALSLLRGIAEEHPERAVLNALQRAELELNPKQAAFDTLEGRLVAQGDERERAELYRWAAEHAAWVTRAGSAARVELLFRAAQIFARVGDTARQASCLRRVLELDRNFEPALDFFRQHLRFDPLAFYQLLAPAALAAHSPAQRAERQAELAQLSQHAIGDSDRAVFHWNQVLGVPGASDALKAEALKELRKVCLENGRREELLDLLEQLAQQTSEPQEQVRLYWELVDLHREFDTDSEQTQRTLNKILRILPNDRKALASLAEIQIEQGDLAAAIESLRSQLETLSGDEQQRHRLRLSRILAEQADDWNGALALILEQIRLHPSEERTFRELQRLLLQDETFIPERSEAALAAIETLAEEQEPELRVAILRLRARLLACDSERADDALAAWQEVLELAPQSLPDVLAFARFCEEMGEWEKAAEIYEQGIEHLDREAQLALSIRLAEAWVNAEQHERARAALKTVLELQPSNVDALRALSTLAGEAGDASAGITVALRLAELSEQAGERVQKLYEAAQLLEQQGELEQAQDSLEKLLALDPNNEAALRRLRKLAQRLEQYHKLVEILERLAQVGRDDKQRRADLADQAFIYESSLGELRAAIAIHRRILADSARERDSLEALVRLHVKLGDAQEALKAIDTLIRVAPERRLELMLEAAEVIEEHTDAPHDAFARYRWAHDLAPDDPRPLHKM
ncbi:MAG: tetratricopeptide repeat protein, partial [Myxococcota bacterium]|nr:tetratricopeptide repeat protein [Myxococcota bacterium]